MKETASQQPGSRPEQDRLAGVEAWLRSPYRLALLVAAAFVVVTAATSLGDVELRRAWGFGPDESDLVIKQAVLWLTWALAAPLLVWLAVRLAGVLRHWTLALAAQVGIGVVVGSLMLLLENAVVVQLQGPEHTARVRERVEWMEARMGGDRRPGAERERRRPEIQEDGDDPRRREERRDDRRRRRPRAGPVVFGIATGDTVQDFERSWPLRVPRYALVYLALVGIGLGIRSFLVGRAREREAQDLAVRASQLEAALTEARLSALKGQLHPHFLFNALHSVGGLIRTERPGEALTALASIGDLLRTSLDAGGEQLVPLERELDLVERYLAVETLRLGDRLRITIDAPRELLGAEVPAFIAQPLVENAVKHAIAPSANGGSVTVRVRSRDGVELVLDVEDDGPGFDPGARTGVGLNHVRTRLAALFDDAASLEMTTREEGGARARVVLPLDDLEEDMEAGR
ncbi:MAG: histidine kinase [Planctomycetota bacterium]